MTHMPLPPTAMDGKNPANLRGDAIDAGTLFLATVRQGRVGPSVDQDLACGGPRERTGGGPATSSCTISCTSRVFIVRQDDGSLRGYYNSCGHRGIRLVSGSSSLQRFACPYHGWVWAQGRAFSSTPPTPTTFPTATLAESFGSSRCGSPFGGGFVLVHDERNSSAVARLSRALPQALRRLSNGTPRTRLSGEDRSRRQLEIRAGQFLRKLSRGDRAPPRCPISSSRIRASPGWRCIRAVMGGPWQPFRPSLTVRPPDEGTDFFDALLRQWDLDPGGYSDFETKVIEGWKDLKAAKRALWRERGLRPLRTHG